MPISWKARFRWVSRPTAAGIFAIILAGQSLAQDRFLPVPRVTLYPGDQIYDNLIEERPFSYESVAQGAAMESREGLVGKVARRTLLPGKPIAPISIDNQKLVQIGAQVKIVFIEAGLEITAYGMAMQSGAVGEQIRVRNQDSGLIISGRVRGDGSVLVSEA